MLAELEGLMGCNSVGLGLILSHYGLLFQSKSLHFVHSSYSVQWLSKIPQHIQTSNKRNIYISRTSSPTVVDGYYNQFRSDFSMFLRCRSEEIVHGGWMVLTLIGRCNEERYSNECCYMWDLLATVLNQMVSEGLINEDKMNSFNIPNYYPSPKEIKGIVQDEGSFTIDCLELFQTDWDPNTSHSHPHIYTAKNKLTKEGSRNNNDGLPLINDENSIAFVSCIRAVMEPILVDHFGAVIIEEVFERYNHIVADSMSKEMNFFSNITLSMYKN